MLLAGGLVTAATPVTALPGVACEWTPRVGPDDVNVGAPDGSAYYWVYPFTAVPGTRLKVSGVYPDARYFSFQILGLRVPPVVYGPVTASVYDQAIQPDAGSDNPYAGPVATPTDPQRYTITVEFTTPPATPAPNTIYALDNAGGTSWGGALWYRIYVPSDPSSPNGSVTMPKVDVQTTGGQVVKPGSGCANDAPSTGAPVREVMGTNDFPVPVPPAGTPAAPVWRRHFTGGGAEQVAYLTTTIDRQYGNVVVVRGKAPTFPDTGAGEHVYDSYNMRYWSLCQYWIDSLVKCSADHETAVDSGGYYTFVISDPSQRPANATAANGVTWIPWGATNEGGEPVPENVKAGLWLRNMLPDSSFANAVQAVPTDTADPAPIMGDYYPDAVYCDKATFEAGGYSACY